MLDYKKIESMERQAIYEKLTEIFREVMDNESIVLCDSTNADDIEEWDSLAHVQLMTAIQKVFKVKITAREIVSWANVGEMVDALEKKIQ